jgi:hypothetical protein
VGVVVGEKASWSFSSVFMLCWTLRMFILLNVVIRSLKAFTIASAG